MYNVCVRYSTSNTTSLAPTWRFLKAQKDQAEGGGLVNQSWGFPVRTNHFHDVLGVPRMASYSPLHFLLYLILYIQAAHNFLVRSARQDPMSPKPRSLLWTMYISFSKIRPCFKMSENWKPNWTIYDHPNLNTDDWSQVYLQKPLPLLVPPIANIEKIAVTPRFVDAIRSEALGQRWVWETIRFPHLHLVDMFFFFGGCCCERGKKSGWDI